MTDEDAYQYTVKMQRGDGTDDRDTLKTQVSAETIDELEDKVERARELMAAEMAEVREIQPDDTRTLADKQQQFEDVGAES